MKTKYKIADIDNILDYLKIYKPELESDLS
jgi:hypothetical protein